MATDWAEVYRSTFPDLVRFLHRKVWDPDRARDLAQEAFVRALRHEPRRPRAWLFRVASNLARDEARTVLRRKRHLALLRAEGDGARAASPAAELERAERSRRVREALESLGERDREALLLWDAGLGYPDIARHLGLSVGAVGTTLARARRRLARAHAERCEEDGDVARG